MSEPELQKSDKVNLPKFDSVCSKSQTAVNPENTEPVFGAIPSVGTISLSFQDTFAL